ncbi:MAG: hypothetical protein AB1716_01060 [Planctomycetota bacterium]
MDISAEARAIYGTGSHGDETLAARGGSVPAQMRWSDLHPPGVKVLPKGSPPAGPGEINWEDTLGGQFATALTKLEGLFYAVYGSRPLYEANRQWYDRENLRCLWALETWEQSVLPCPGTGHMYGACYEYQPTGKEYVARGESPPCCPLPAPSVPIRSRSSDPAEQFQRGIHDRGVFPLGSVGRDHDAEPFDPEGHGYFGATQPGRQDGGGPHYDPGQAVTFTYTAPPGVTVYGVHLFFRTKPPGGAWSVWNSQAMSGPGTYTTALGPYAHGTECRWYVRVWTDQGYRYDPGATAAPADGEAYYLQWFTHYNPFARGFPETLASYGGVDVRHGTDFYQFDGSECVQPELLNLVRFALSALVGSTCQPSSPGCGESSPLVVHHSPLDRAAEECCVDMPIRWRWSGSAPYPHYRAGGKGGTDGTEPLHNGCGEPNPAGTEGPRKSWRGIEMLYTPQEHFDNFWYGGGFSWGVAPGLFALLYQHDTPAAQIYARFQEVGLRPGDVIEAVHIREIIDAVEYLIANGIWHKTDVRLSPRTPGTYLGRTCGFSYSFETVTDLPSVRIEEEDWCKKCCAPDPACSGFKHDEWYGGEWNPGASYQIPPFVCVPHPAPTWEECWAPGFPTGVCGMAAVRWGTCSLALPCPPYGAVARTYEGWSIDCDVGMSNYCGQLSHGRYCDPPGSPACDFHASEYHVTVSGFSAYLCTPPACRGGPDASHGNQIAKLRFDHVWHSPGGGLFQVATGTSGKESMGNCWGQLYHCEEAGPKALTFAAVNEINFPGLANGRWFNWVHCDDVQTCPPLEEAQEPPPEIPGLGLHNPDRTAMCTKYRNRPVGGSPYLADGIECACSGSYSVCAGEHAWVAVDLNLDAAGVPTLRPYDLNQVGLMSDCPCETWTALSQLCAIT